MWEGQIRRTFRPGTDGEWGRREYLRDCPRETAGALSANRDSTLLCVNGLSVGACLYRLFILVCPEKQSDLRGIETLSEKESMEDTDYEV